MKASFVSFLKNRYSHLDEAVLRQAIADQLLSPFQIKLSRDQLDRLKSQIKWYGKLRDWSELNLTDQYYARGLKKPQNYSVCMSYDFHINPEGLPELIEINTNASFLALGLEMYDFLKLPNAAADFKQADLIKMFLAEHQIVSQESDPSFVIIDDEPKQQRLYVEFLIYQQLLQEHDLKCGVVDFRNTEAIEKATLIYNRYTDFYLEQPVSAHLKKLFNERANFSPNPYEYFLLADKQRQLDWNKQTEVAKPSSLLKSYDLGSADRDQIWNERKQLFIKPKNSFGSKQAYKAASISKKTFEEVFNSNFIAQQLSVPAEVEVNVGGQLQNMKYDLRCYAYKGELQLIVARLYQGQTTNLRTLGGGFAAVVIDS